MKKVEVIPLTDFFHGGQHFVERPPYPMIDEALANEFERRGLVRVRLVPRRVDVALVQRGSAETVARKLPAAGAEQQSSASPADRVSPQTATPTSSSSVAGVSPKTRRKGRAA